jgi:hypothetical protein
LKVLAGHLIWFAFAGWGARLNRLPGASPGDMFMCATSSPGQLAAIQLDCIFIIKSGRTAWPTSDSLFIFIFLLTLYLYLFLLRGTVKKGKPDLRKKGTTISNSYTVFDVYACFTSL